MPRKRPQTFEKKFHEALQKDLDRARRALRTDKQTQCCLGCGLARSTSSFTLVRKDKLPLTAGIVNFYPGFSYGVPLCGLCTLALRFLPFSLLRIGDQGRIWFLHCQELSISGRIARKYGWEYFEGRIAKNQEIDFYGNWRSSGEAGAVLRLLCQLLLEFHRELDAIYSKGIPTTAYIFGNDNRGGFIRSLTIPSEILIFLQKLLLQSEKSFLKFEKELLEVPAGLPKKELNQRAGFVATVSNRIVRSQPIVGICLVRGSNDTPFLLGGWVAHRLYLREVIGMSQAVLHVCERVGLAIAQHPKAKRLVGRLERADTRELRPVFLELVREGFLSARELAAILPAGSPAAASLARDVILAVVYEWYRCQAQGEVFPQLSPVPLPEPDKALQRLFQIADQLEASLTNLPRWLAELQKARTTARIRGVYLQAVRSGALNLEDFLFLAPLEATSRTWLLRDYLLAVLYERLRPVLPSDEEADLLVYPEDLKEEMLASEEQW